ncbi:hypothetical protein BS47DRAFT_1382489 [Hydnum rufescens UP504]|uniref:Uncharacterized protein n=1 Tax=Hydnum rufescens UP504 TaxID=1448309 RepID=A0A9P6AX88_9AGAM|nr:hypothetical protein BS47DRAFT_1382489 [Hydnum rufescens UP504]
MVQCYAAEEWLPVSISLGVTKRVPTGHTSVIEVFQLHGITIWWTGILLGMGNLGRLAILAHTGGSAPQSVTKLPLNCCLVLTREEEGDEEDIPNNGMVTDVSKVPQELGRNEKRWTEMGKHRMDKNHYAGYDGPNHYKTGNALDCQEKLREPLRAHLGCLSEHPGQDEFRYICFRQGGITCNDCLAINSVVQPFSGVPPIITQLVALRTKD